MDLEGSQVDLESAQMDLESSQVDPASQGNRSLKSRTVGNGSRNGGMVLSFATNNGSIDHGWKAGNDAVGLNFFKA